MVREDTVPIAEHIDVPILRRVLFQQTRLLDRLIATISSQPNSAADPDRALIEVTTFMAHALGISIHSILKLTEHQDMAVRDCFGIARSAHELALNASFVLAVGNEEALRAKRHAEQRSYRDLHRKGEVGGYAYEIRASGLMPQDEIPGMGDALAEFAPFKDWPGENPSKRMEKIKEVSPSAAFSLAGAHIAGYRIASELLHGSYFGVVYFWGGAGGQPAHTRDQFAERWREHFMTIFSATFFSTLGLLQIASEKFQTPDILEECRQHVVLTNAEIQRLTTGPDGSASITAP